MSAGARSSRQPSASARGTSSTSRRRQRRALQTPGERPRSPLQPVRCPGSSNLRTIWSCCHCPSRSGVQSVRLASREHPALRTTLPPRRPQAFRAAGSSACRLAAGRSRRGHLRRRGLDRSSDAPRPTSVQTPSVSDNQKMSDGSRLERTLGQDPPSPSWVRPFFEWRRAWGRRLRVWSSRRGNSPPSGCEGRASWRIFSGPAD